eukprot:GFKZ01013299.1.p1 GENE.GFKZ01013299.1~~GFKZ01013299.1.p1  ORF type:complete len:390 (-),score=44.61 GFKZ01013299.1:305-1372(-)
MSLLRSALRLSRVPYPRYFSSAAYQISEHGKASAVLCRESRQTPPSATGDNLIVKWLAAGIDPVDLAAVRGDPAASAFAPPTLPAVPGSEGVGIVEHAGPGVSSVKSGDFVIPIKPSLGTWCESAVVNESQVMRIPNTLRLELAATLSASPFTALRLLSDFGALSPGDVVVVNKASSAVGTAVVQIASALSLRTVCLVTESSGDYAPTVERLKLMGSSVVVDESYAGSAALSLVMSDLPKPKLGINGGDKESCSVLASLIGKGGTVVSYCPGSSNDGAVKGAGLTAATFSLPEWLASSERKDVEAMVTQLTDLIEGGKLTAWLQRVKFEELPAVIDQGGPAQRKLVALMPGAESL